MSEIKTKLEIESYLPIFTGFYGTIWGSDEESEIEEGKVYDDYEWHNDDYMNRISQSCVNGISEQLTDLDIKVEFQSISSPKYYNFSNDTINVKYILGENSIDKVLQYLMDNSDNFDNWLKENYSSRDGFISFHSTNKTDWINDLLNNNELEHKFGAIISFILTDIIDYNENDLFEYVSGEGEFWISGTLIEK